LKNKAIFLDRDGVINHDPGDYTWKPEDFHLLPGAVEFMQWATEMGYLLIVITNQAGIARKLYTHQDVQHLMDGFVRDMAGRGVAIAEYYYSPHYDVIENSLDRKPGSLLIEKGLARFDIDRNLSCFIGDREKDMLAAQAAGVKGIKVETNSGPGHLINALA
jgi:D-glycero-D-manno-heptose 1,7-bisphosphate phosphatase